MEVELFRKNTEVSVRLQSLYHQVHIRSGITELNEEIREKYANISQEQKTKILQKFGKEFPEIMTSIKQNQINNSFAVFWSKVMLLTFTYNFFTCFWLLGFPGFPSGVWFYCEALTEIICLIDFIARLVFPRLCKRSWEIMFLLHDRDEDRVYLSVLRGIASVPTSLILSAAMHSTPAKLKTFWVACIRLFKMLRFRNFQDYFDPQTVAEGSQTFWLVSICALLYKFSMGLHFLTILFCLPNRF